MQQFRLSHTFFQKFFSLSRSRSRISTGSALSPTPGLPSQSEKILLRPQSIVDDIGEVFPLTDGSVSLITSCWNCHKFYLYKPSLCLINASASWVLPLLRRLAFRAFSASWRAFALERFAPGFRFFVPIFSTFFLATFACLSS